MINYKVIPLGEILSKEYDIQLIEQAFKEFSCQRETDLENFLIQKAIPYEKTNYRKIAKIISVCCFGNWETPNTQNIFHRESKLW